VGPVASTTEVEKDVDVGPPGGALLAGSAAATTDVEDDVDDRMGVVLQCTVQTLAWLLVQLEHSNVRHILL
jgi:hypothetical protein